MKLFATLSLLFFALIASANQTSLNVGALSTPVQLKALTSGSSVDDPNNWSNLLEIGVVTKHTTGVVSVDVMVQVWGTKGVSAVCRLQPKSYLGRPMDPSLTALDFVVETPKNQGVNPQAIVANSSTTRTLFGKISAETNGAFFQVLCRRQLGNDPVSVQAASIKALYVEQ